MSSWLKRVATQRAADILTKITQIPLYFNKSARGTRGENYSRQILFKSIPFVKFNSRFLFPDHIFHGELAIFAPFNWTRKKEE